MCRHLAFIGAPTSLAQLLLAPEHGLLKQSWAPRHQQHGTINADGFGVGWYAHGAPLPARYRRSVPIWTDPSFADVARVTFSSAVLAAVRSATEGMPSDESAAAPYKQGRPWLFSHNGRIEGWPEALEGLAARIPAARLLALESAVDSALLWALVLDRLEAGEDPALALARVVVDVSAAADGRLNFLLTDGKRIYATTAGDTLFWHSGADGTVVASEPYSDGSGWNEVPDQSVLTATADGVDIRPIGELTGLIGKEPFPP